MRSLLAVLVLAALVAPVYGVLDYFPVAGDGSFDVISSGTNIDGYGNNGSGGSARLGYSKQGIGWVAWDAKNSSGVQSTSAGQNSGQTMAQFLAGNSINGATLYLNLNTATLVGAYALHTLRVGNSGVIQEDGSSGVGKTYLAPAAGIAGSTQPFAWKSGAGPWTSNGLLNADDEKYIAVGTTGANGWETQFTAGGQVHFHQGANPPSSAGAPG